MIIFKAGANDPEEEIRLKQKPSLSINLAKDGKLSGFLDTLDASSSDACKL